LLSTYEAALSKKPPSFAEARDFNWNRFNETLEFKGQRTDRRVAQITERKQAEEKIRDKPPLLDKAQEAIMVLRPRRPSYY